MKKKTIVEEQPEVSGPVIAYKYGSHYFNSSEEAEEYRRKAKEDNEKQERQDKFTKALKEFLVSEGFKDGYSTYYSGWGPGLAGLDTEALRVFLLSNHATIRVLLEILEVPQTVSFNFTSDPE